MCKNILLHCCLIALLYGVKPCAAHTRDHAYFYEMPTVLMFGGQPFTPVLLSGDGRVLYGDTRLGLVAWTQSDGVQDIPGILPAQPNSVNYNGTVLSGYFTQGDFKLTDYGLFRWSARTGVEILQPHFAPPTHDSFVGPVQVSNDGRRIWFFYNNVHGYSGQCLECEPSVQASWVPKLWSESNGFTNLDPDFHSQFDFVIPSRDAITYVVGVLETSHFGLLNNKGKFVPFKNFPKNFDPDRDRMVMSHNASYFAIVQENGAAGAIGQKTLIWDQEGNFLPPRKLLPGCQFFDIDAIDDTGAIYGSAFCPSIPSSDKTVGLRITSHGAQTIRDWLLSAGIPNSLGLHTEIHLMSDNGKTIYGETNINPVTDTGPGSDINRVNQDCTKVTCVFLAHIP